MIIDTSQRTPRRPAGTARHSDGFSLIELMIAVAVIGILASIAYPSYTGYVERARVSDGQAMVMDIASRLERCYTATYDYKKKNSAGDSCVDFSDLKSKEGYYKITAKGKGNAGSFDSDEYSVVASHIDGEPAVACETLWIDSTGKQGGANDDCW
ncbi:type IV pilin protein [Halomonas marinisediminis]|uniref:Type IV pilin protein n=1 Tax=Halomonas marinisediminis TaxID=2546095 RepID=A0ABY2DA08_9GAMM|nr:type IV pilin protein [Halomonas marinisediminis]TDB01736.1 type IV pilin protein [Halomonas marinisediminis]